MANLKINDEESVPVHLYVWSRNAVRHFPCNLPATIAPATIYHIGCEHFERALSSSLHMEPNKPVIIPSPKLIKDEQYEWYDRSVGERLVVVCSSDGEISDNDMVVLAYFSDKPLHDRQLANLTRLTCVDTLWIYDRFHYKHSRLPIIERELNGERVPGLEHAHAAYYDFLDWWLDRQLNRVEGITRLFGVRPIYEPIPNDGEPVKRLAVYGGIDIINKHNGNFDARVEFLPERVSITDPYLELSTPGPFGSVEYDDPKLNEKIAEVLGRVKPSHDEEVHDNFRDGLPDDELKKIARDLLENRIFTSAHISEYEDPCMCFLVIALMPHERRAALLDLSADFYYSNYADAAPRSCNGYPMFFSCRVMTRFDANKMLGMYRKMKEAIEAI